ncbi:MAG: fructosamine kinase family protein [Myxococcales bacterium]|nr:fructosamine kinase family protein [Myxococcales bacterium]
MRRAVRAALGTPVIHAQPVSGGSINAAARLDTAAGPVFLKWNAHPIPDQFEREAAGLQALADAGSGLRVPRPLHAARPQGDAPGFLLLEWLPEGRRAADFDERLGVGLAALHRATAPRFGFDADTYCGATPQPNGWRDDWLEFYRDQRLGHLLRLAVDHRGVPGAERRAFERLLTRLPEWLATDPEPPALIHGDLWAGNVHVAPDGAPGLIDPAVSYSHREAELGMMALFGGFGSRTWAAYEAAWPLQPGWRERLPLYTLFHVLNHYVLFGGPYGPQAWATVRRFVGAP